VKKIFFTLFVFALLTGCQSGGLANFDVSMFISKNATDVIVSDVDFDGDTIAEKVLVYKNLTSQSLKVIAYDEIDEVWKLVQEDEFMTTSESAPITRLMQNYYPHDFNSDGKVELVVEWTKSSERSSNSYYVIGYYQGAFKIVDQPIQENTELILDGIRLEEFGIIESYNGGSIEQEVNYEFAILDRVEPIEIK